MKSILAIAVLAAGFSTLSINQADAQNWCGRSNLNGAEAVICDNSDLGALDGRMASIYFQLLRIRPGELRWLRSDQRSWLRSRNSCGYNYNCVRSYYVNRISFLNSL